jgi:hypothetical protein
VSRSADLLKLAADALENGEDPLALHFLREHDVESGECLDLADSLAMGARLIAWAMEHPKQAIAAARGAGTGLQYHDLMEAFARLDARREG